MTSRQRQARALVAAAVLACAAAATSACAGGALREDYGFVSMLGLVCLTESGAFGFRGDPHEPCREPDEQSEPAGSRRGW